MTVFSLDAEQWRDEDDVCLCWTSMSRFSVSSAASCFVRQRRLIQHNANRIYTAASFHRFAGAWCAGSIIWRPQGIPWRPQQRKCEKLTAYLRNRQIHEEFAVIRSSENRFAVVMFVAVIVKPRCAVRTVIKNSSSKMFPSRSRTPLVRKMSS